MAKKYKRDYALEYQRDHSDEEAITRRAARNKARRLKAARVGKAALQGKEIDHKDFNPMNNHPSNLRIVSKQVNRKKQPKRK